MERGLAASWTQDWGLHVCELVFTHGQHDQYWGHHFEWQLHRRPVVGQPTLDDAIRGAQQQCAEWDARKTGLKLFVMLG